MKLSHGPQPLSQSLPARPPVGERLRFQREQLGWSLPEVADWLRIKLVYLQALEDGRPQDLPGHTYAVGFLRNYASSLGMDAQELSQHFRQEATGLDRPDLHFPSPMPERGVPAGAAVLIGVVLLAFAYAGWYMYAGHEKLPIQSVPPLPASMIPYASGSAPAAPKVAAAAAPAPPATVVLPPPAPPSPLAVPPDAPAQADASVGVTVKASSSSWVQVKQDGGPVIYEHILQAGESWSAPPGSGKLLLSIGNAGGITLSAGTLTTRPLGPPGAVRRNLPLDPGAVRDDIRQIGTTMNQPGFPKQPGNMNQTGQSPPFLAGSGRDGTPPAKRDGQDGGQSDPEH